MYKSSVYLVYFCCPFIRKKQKVRVDDERCGNKTNGLSGYVNRILLGIAELELHFEMRECISTYGTTVENVTLIEKITMLLH